MNFEMSDDRRMLAESLARFLADTCPVEKRVDVAYAEPWHSETAWAGLAELGALYALAPEEAGGMGGTGFDIAVVFEELGKALCPEPVLASLLGLRLLAAAGQDLEPVLAGERVAVGIGELDAPYDLDGIETRAEDGKLTGRKSVVYGGPGAERLLIAAQSGGKLALFEVKAGDAQVTGYGMIDGGPAAEVFLDDTPAYPAAFFGAVRAGFVPVLLNTLTTPDLLQFYLNDTGARIAVCDADFVDRFTIDAVAGTDLQKIVMVNGGTAKGQFETEETFLSGHPGQLDAAGQSLFVRCTTHNVFGDLALASGLVLLPATPVEPAGQWPLVVYGHMTTGAADACAPTRGVPESSELRRMQQGDTLATALLNLGMVVARPDYEGLGEAGPHPYLRGDSLARAMRDMASAPTTSA